MGNKLTIKKHGEVIQLRVVDKNSHKVLESYEFNSIKELDNCTFFEIADKLGFSFKKYKAYKQTEWQ